MDPIRVSFVTEIDGATIARAIGEALAKYAPFAAEHLQEAILEDGSLTLLLIDKDGGKSRFTIDATGSRVAV